MRLVWCYRLATCLQTSQYLPLINITISEADSRFYNWKVLRKLHTQSQADVSTQKTRADTQDNINHCFLWFAVSLSKHNAQQKHQRGEIFPPKKSGKSRHMNTFFLSTPTKLSKTTINHTMEHSFHSVHIFSQNGRSYDQ